MGETLKLILSLALNFAAASSEFPHCILALAPEGESVSVSRILPLEDAPYEFDTSSPENFFSSILKQAEQTAPDEYDFEVNRAKKKAARRSSLLPSHWQIELVQRELDSGVVFNQNYLRFIKENELMYAYRVAYNAVGSAKSTQLHINDLHREGVDVSTLERQRKEILATALPHLESISKVAYLRKDLSGQELVVVPWESLQISSLGIFTYNEISWVPVFEARAYNLEIKLPNKRYHSILLMFRVNSINDPLKNSTALANTLKAISNLPTAFIESLDVIIGYGDSNPNDSRWSEFYEAPGLQSAAGAGLDKLGRGTVVIFLDTMLQPSRSLLPVFRHELGHLIAIRDYGSSMPSQAWLEAMELDAPDDPFSLKFPKEGFAISFEEYLHFKSLPTPERWLTPFPETGPNRFKLLEASALRTNR